MTKLEKAREKKKTNFQRLWRNAKKSEVLAHNFAEDVVTVTRNIVTKKLKKEDLEGFEKAIQFLRDKYSDLSAKSG